jgi:hypothetical protein
LSFFNLVPQEGSLSDILGQSASPLSPITTPIKAKPCTQIGHRVRIISCHSNKIHSRATPTFAISTIRPIPEPLALPGNGGSPLAAVRAKKRDGGRIELEGSFR